MSRKRCHRKVWALVDPISTSIAGAAITDTAILDKLRLIELSSLENFKNGSPTIDDWKAMADVLNVAETLALSGVGPEVLAACGKVQAVLAAGHGRYVAHGTIGRAAGEYEALAELCAYHDLQRASIGRSEYERAIEKTANRIRGASKAVKVMMEPPKPKAPPREPREFVDLATVPEHQWDMDRRLRNWASACRGGDKQTGKAAPMFMLYKSGDAKREYGAETSVPVNRADAAVIQAAVNMLPEKHMKAIQWFYIHPRNPLGKARELGVNLAGLAVLVVEARQYMINREK